MTYRELIEICYATPADNCTRCKHRKECEAFQYKTDYELPEAFYNALKIDPDEEINVS